MELKGQNRKYVKIYFNYYCKVNRDVIDDLSKVDRPNKNPLRMERKILEKITGYFTQIKNPDIFDWNFFCDNKSSYNITIRAICDFHRDETVSYVNS